jgi:hypothetical protein
MDIQKLKLIIENLEKVIEDNLEVSNKEIFQEAVKIYLSEGNIGEVKKDNPASQMKPATEKQIEFAKSLGFVGDPSKLSSYQMSEIIKNLKDKPPKIKKDETEEDYDY